MKWGDRLKKDKILKTPEIIAAFNEIDRTDFLPAKYKAHADDDNPLPIGLGQTNSAPSVVGQMLEWLQPKQGQKILDIGSGSGWTTTLLAHIVGPKGKVVGLDRIDELVDVARKNVAKYGFKHLELYPSDDGILGWARTSDFDRVLVSATAQQEMVDGLLAQLKDSGQLVIPLAEDSKEGFTDHCIHVFTKTADKCLDDQHPGYVFVPIILKSAKNSELFGD